jgi:hypothetical protein
MPTEAVELERIVVIAETLYATERWVRANSYALSGDGEVSVYTADNANRDRLRGITCHRLIILGHPKQGLVDEALITCRHDPAKVIRMGFTDRLAAGWRDA